MTPATKIEAQRLAEKVAVPLLELGKEEQARSELERALVNDPANKLALSLMRQITDDPVAWLGKESFSYQVRPNDTLSSIAGQQMKERDKYLFYILARYNNIAVPKQISAGQNIKVPGKKGQTPQAQPPSPPAPAPGGQSGSTTTPGTQAPAPATPPAPTPPPPPPAPPPGPAGDKDFRQGLADEQAGRLDRAREAFKAAADAGNAAASAKVAAVTTKLIERYTAEARTARSKQNLDAAIAAWDKVLALDPDNAAARGERAQVVDLKKILDQQTKGAPKN